APSGQLGARLLAGVVGERAGDHERQPLHRLRQRRLGRCLLLHADARPPPPLDDLAMPVELEPLLDGGRHPGADVLDRGQLLLGWEFPGRTSSWHPSCMVAAIRGPMSSPAASSSSVASMIAPMDRISAASFGAVGGPTCRMESATSTRQSGASRLTRSSSAM